VSFPPSWPLRARLIRSEYKPALHTSEELALHMQLVDVNRDIRKFEAEVQEHVAGVVKSSNMLACAKAKFAQLRRDLGLSNEELLG
jgi:dimeric dUTPase (all-alpha-NTP-PPase superfamily)